MVTTFNAKDMTSFGKYLLSDERRERFKTNPNFQDELLLEERLKEVHHADVENWKDSISKVQKVRAKFVCNAIGSKDEHKDSESTTIYMSAVYGTEGENADFTKYTPGGDLSMMVDKDARALELFEEGREYYIEFFKAPIE